MLPTEAQSQYSARRLVFARDQGVCADCGTIHAFNGPWQADHRIPLWKVHQSTYQEAVWYWRLVNLQTLCTEPCHRIKSSKETSERDHHKRLVKKRAGKAARQRLTRTIGGKIRDTRRKLPW